MASIYRRRRDGPWVIAYCPLPGVRKVVSGCDDYKATSALARKLEGDAMLRRKGVIDSREDRYTWASGQTAGEHLADFRASLLARGVTARQAGEVSAKVARLLSAASIERIGHIVPSKIQAAIGELRAGGLSLQSCNHYLRAAKQFSRWLHRDGRTREDAVAFLKAQNVATDRRHDRRALTDDELAALLQAAEAGPTIQGMTGPDRAMLYRLAAGTGFRRNEIRTLTPEAFALEADPPTITIEAGYSKHRKVDVQPIRRDLADMFRDWLQGKPQGAPVFNMPEKPVEAMKADLRRARAAWIKAATLAQDRRSRARSSFALYRDGSGLVADFHALRHTYISRLVGSGASVKVCQELARHSTPLLTLGRYAHVQLVDRVKALEAVPCPTVEQPQRQTAKATGTDHATAEHAAQERVKRAAPGIARRVPFRAISCNTVQRQSLDGGAVDGVVSRLNCKTLQHAATISNTQARVAQLDRASVYGTEGYWFEPSRAYLCRSRRLQADRPRFRVGIPRPCRGLTPRKHAVLEVPCIAR